MTGDSTQSLPSEKLWGQTPAHAAALVPSCAGPTHPEGVVDRGDLLSGLSSLPSLTACWPQLATAGLVLAAA